MNTRISLEEDWEVLDSLHDSLVFEVLLDIRDLLANKEV